MRRLVSKLIKSQLYRRGRTIVSAKLPWAIEGYRQKNLLASGATYLIDIGANEGQFASSCRNAGFTGAIVSFEPQSAAFKALDQFATKDGNWRCFNFALGETSTVAPMHISAFSPSSSLCGLASAHVELMPYTHETGNEDVEVRRLDDLVSPLGLEPSQSFLKIDVQGYEGPVIRGALDVVRQVRGVVVELNFAELFVGQTRVHEVLQLLDDAGLRLAALVDQNTHPDTHELLWADGVFVRRDTSGV